MDLIFKTHHLPRPLDDGFKSYAQRKLDRLARYLPTVREAVLELRHEQTRAAEQRYRVQVTVNSNGTWLRAEERAADPRAAVDLASDSLGKQIRRHKDRSYRSGHAGHERERVKAAVLEPAVEEFTEDDDQLVLGRVVREKRYPIEVMTVEEAAEQMELLGHDFFFFFDGEEKRYSLLYRRRDGDYGLIRPEK